MQYIEVLNNLKRSVNEKGLNLLFSQSIKTLKDDFHQEISTKFLRGLSDIDDLEKRSQRIKYLLKRNEFNTKRVLNIYEVRGTNQYKSDVIIWGHDKKDIPFKYSGLTDSEKRQIQEIKQLKEETGISLFPFAEQKFNDRKKTTDAFNLGGGAVIRDVKVFGVGKYSVGYREEVLFIIC